jgi:hypothetical protein
MMLLFFSFVNHMALELLPLNSSWQPGDYQGHVNKAYGGCLQAAAQVPRGYDTDTLLPSFVSFKALELREERRLPQATSTFQYIRPLSKFRPSSLHTDTLLPSSSATCLWSFVKTGDYPRPRQPSSTSGRCPSSVQAAFIQILLPSSSATRFWSFYSNQQRHHGFLSFLPLLGHPCSPRLAHIRSCSSSTVHDGTSKIKKASAHVARQATAAEILLQKVYSCLRHMQADVQQWREHITAIGSIFPLPVARPALAAE